MKFKVTVSITGSRKRDNGDVLVEGTYFPRSELPEVLGRFIRRSVEAERAHKKAFVELTELQRRIARDKEPHA